MKFKRWTGIEVEVITEDSPTHPPDDVGDIYLRFPTWGSLKALVLEVMGSLLDMGIMPHSIAQHIITGFDKRLDGM
jgi:hypothetical protein